MSGSQGYSLEQLLAWSLEDSLIDGYEHCGDRLVILQGRRRREIPFKEARRYLVGMFREHLGPIRGAPGRERCAYVPHEPAQVLVNKLLARNDRPLN